MQVIPTRVHGTMDYLIGALLIATPSVLGFDRGGAETWVPVVLGASVILYSFFTDHELGVVRRLPMPIHLMLDFASGVLLAVSPWLFGFADYVSAPHVVVGLTEIGTVLMSQRVPSDGRRIHAPGAPGVAGRTSGASHRSV